MNNSQKEGSRFIDVLVQKGYLHAGLSETLALAECLNRIINYRVEKAIDEDRTILSMLDDCSPSTRHDEQVRKDAVLSNRNNFKNGA